MSDLVDKQSVYDTLTEYYHHSTQTQHDALMDALCRVPSVQPERLTDDDLETIRIHLSAVKEKLCNQRRWEEAEEYERIINRLKTLEFVQPEQRWIPVTERLPETGQVVLWCNEHGSVFTSAITYRTDKYYSVGQHRGSIVAWMPLPEPYKQV